MGASHCEDQSIAVHCDDVPWARQSLRLRRLVSLLIETLLTCADHSEHLLGRDVDLANGVILAVAQIDEVLVFAEHVAESMRVVELSFVIISID